MGWGKWESVAAGRHGEAGGAASGKAVAGSGGGRTRQAGGKRGAAEAGTEPTAANS